jgi:membrane protease YdiL (CAAX protease family)
MPTFPGLTQSLGLLLFGLAAMLGFLGLLGTLELPVTVPVLASSVLGSLAALTLGILAGRRRPLRSALRLDRHTGAGWSALAPILLGAFVLTMQLVSLTHRVWPPPPFFLHLMEQIGEPSSASERLLTLLLAGVMGPVAEELLFRGLILHGLAGRYGERTGIIVSAMLFSVYHLNPWQGVAALQLGLLLGWLTCRSGRIGYAIALHCGNNLIALLVVGLIPDQAAGAAEAQALSVLSVGLLLIVAAVALVWGLHRFARSFPLARTAAAALP